MDILHLVDRLEELFNNSKPIPLTHNVMVDENAFMDIIDQMRISIPDDIKKAQQIMAQKDRILAQAQEEANRTVTIARDKSEKMVEKSDVFQAAQAKIDLLAEEARKNASMVQADADRYVVETLQKLQAELDKVSNQVQNGIKVLQAEVSQPEEEK
jgi:cell division septum initiation protein DivIVA